MSRFPWIAAPCLIAATLSVAPEAAAQAVSRPNQIVGDVVLLATHPDLVAELATRPPGSSTMWSFRAASRATSPQLNHSRSFTTPTRTDVGGYEITVEAGTPGIAYDVSLTTYRASGGDNHYVFQTRTSLPVEEEPAPDVRVDFAECVGGIRVAWTDASGGPLTVNGGDLRVHRETAPGSGSFEPFVQAQDDVPAGATEGLILVRGDGSLYRLLVDYELGSDPFSDTLIYRWETTVRVDCDQVATAIVPPSGGTCTDGTDIVLGRIRGVFDVLGEDELPVVGGPSTAWWWKRSRVWAESGPWENARQDLVLGDPSSGPFELENLMPSNVVAPPEPYKVKARAFLRRGHRFEDFEAPRLPVQVPNGADIDLGDDFVMEPILVHGSIRLAGPPRAPEPYGSMLDDLQRIADPDHDPDGDGVPSGLEMGNSTASHSNVSGTGGSTTSAYGGQAWASFEGSLDPAGETFEGDHELVLANPRGLTHPWDVRRLRVQVTERSTPEEPLSWYQSNLVVTAGGPREVSLSPGDVHRLDHHYCLSRLNLAFYSTAGTFFDPSLDSMSGGSFRGLDFEGTDTSYTAIAWAEGTPTEEADAASTGLVVALLAAGDWTLTPTVRSINPGGGTSTTELMPVSLRVGCRQVISMFPDFILELDPVPPCVEAGFLQISGRVRGDADVSRIEATANGGAPVIACTGCGVEPTFTLAIPLDAAPNEIVVRAIDSESREATTSGFTQHVEEPSAIDRRPGSEPLRVRKAAAGGLELTWQDVAGAAANVYRGTLDALWLGRAYDHAGFGACDVAGGRVPVEHPAGGAYFVVGGACGWGDGSLGRDWLGRELPPARNRCP